MAMLVVVLALAACVLPAHAAHMRLARSKDDAGVGPIFWGDSFQMQSPTIYQFSGGQTFNMTVIRMFHEGAMAHRIYTSNGQTDGYSQIISDGQKTVWFVMNRSDDSVTGCHVYGHGNIHRMYISDFLGYVRFEGRSVHVDGAAIAHRLRERAPHVVDYLHMGTDQPLLYIADMTHAEDRCVQYKSTLRTDDRLSGFPGRSKRQILPDTNWCGGGSQAEELGNSTGIDSCCREHDLCPHFIEAWSTRYHYTNYGLYTVSHCACDEAFKYCLRDISHHYEAGYANMLGMGFFNLAQQECFIFEPYRACVERAWWGRCTRHEDTYRAVMRENTDFDW